MAGSGGPAAYANADDELFEQSARTHTTDQRSVGELLFDVDRQARMLLINVTEDDAAQLLRGWPGLVSAAVNLWRALPRHAGPAGDTATAIDRVAQISDSISRRLTTSPWPPSAVGHPCLSGMASTLDRAASQVHLFADQGLVSNSGREDLDAARARIMHSLYVSAHAVTVALVQHGRTRQGQADPTRRPLDAQTGQVAYASGPATEWVRRMAAAEAAAASFAAPGRLHALLNGAQRVPPSTPSRLTHALARWDIQAHRGLVSPDWRDNMVLITRTQALITGTAMVLVDAAVAVGRLDAPSRLRPALSRAGAAWSDLGSRWDDLTPLNIRPSPQLLLAAGEISGATQELTHDELTMANPHTIAGRPGLNEALDAVLHALEHTDELAHAVADKGTTPGLTGRARALSIRAHNEVEALHIKAGHTVVPLEDDTVWVSPTDILAKHMVAAPLPVTHGIQISGRAVVQAATQAGAIACSVRVSPTLLSRKDAYERQAAAANQYGGRSPVQTAVQQQPHVPAGGPLHR